MSRVLLYLPVYPNALTCLLLPVLPCPQDVHLVVFPLCLLPPYLPGPYLTCVLLPYLPTFPNWTVLIGSNRQMLSQFSVLCRIHGYQTPSTKRSTQKRGRIELSQMIDVTENGKRKRSTWQLDP